MASSANTSEPRKRPVQEQRPSSGTPQAELPGVLLGSPQQIAHTLLRYREEFGTSYISVIEPHVKTFAEVIPLLR
jgi:hypothetical protein